MSIRDFNNIIKKPGCIITVSAVSLVAMAGGVFAGLRGCSANAPGDRTGTPIVVIAHVGDFPVTQNAIDARYDAEAQQQASLGQPGAAQQASLYSFILSQQIDLGLSLAEAKKQGLTVTDEMIKKAIEDDFAQKMTQIKTQLLMSGKLKQNSTQLDFEKALEAASGIKYSDVMAQKEATTKEVMSDSSKHTVAMAETAAQLLPQLLAKKIHPTDDQIKQTFLTLTTKRILFAAGAKDQVDKAVADLKGGASFETVIDRYTKDTTNNGKKPSQTETSLTGAQLATGPLQVLRTFKEGQVSDPLEIPEGIAIYKVIKVKSDLPKDFDKQKEALTQQNALSQASAQIANDKKELLKSGIVTFSDKGWEALYNISKIRIDGLTGATREAKLKEILTTASQLVKSGGGASQKIAALAYYEATNELYTDAQDKTKYDDDRIASFQAVRAFAPSSQDDLTMARLLAKKHDQAGTAQSLGWAIEDNPVAGQTAAGISTAIQQAVADFIRDKAITDAQAQKINEDLSKWIADKKSYDDEAAKAQAAQRDAQIQQAKEKADYEKAQKDAAKAGATQTTAGTAPKTDSSKPADPKADPKKTAPSTPTAPPINLGGGSN